MVLFSSLYIILLSTLFVESFHEVHRWNFQSLPNVDLQNYETKTEEPQSKVLVIGDPPPKSKRRSHFYDHSSALSRHLIDIKSLLSQLLSIAYNERRDQRAERKREILTKRKSNGGAQPKWGPWTEWSPCSVTCGKGREIKWRHCLHSCDAGIETEMEEKTCQLPACGSKLFGIVHLR